MASRDNFPDKSTSSADDSNKQRNGDKCYRGGTRRGNKYHRNFHNDSHFNTRNNFNFSYRNSFNRNFYFNRDANDAINKDNKLSWRRSKNMESLINQRESLVTQITQCHYECMICYMNIQLETPIWSCENCFHIFHINCIEKWSLTCVNENKSTNWRCPACQNEYPIFVNNLCYKCYCGKTKNPCYNRAIIPHSCGEMCGKSSKNNPRCRHHCSLLCHPGPCPLCEASIKSNCHCGKAEFIVKCTASDDNLSCGKICEKVLNCSVHTCQEICHSTNCSPCQEVISQTCCCQNTTRQVLCGSAQSYDTFFTCNNVCNRIKDCGIHKCDRQCHPSQCESCQRLPKNTMSCACGKTSLTELSVSKSVNGDRESCIDPIPTCNQICDKQYIFCEHKCQSTCHEGDCLPCVMTSNVKCRCKKSSQNMKCAEIARILSSGDSIKCATSCKAKKLCGIHRCHDTCCDVQVHICEQMCSKLLSCKEHVCERACHKGNCPKCDNVSFDELYCTCRNTTMLPPIACGQEPPYCSRPCSRTHLCDHDVAHLCHSEPHCPPCTVLTSKDCPGGHKTMYNIPCFRPVVTCGMVCNKQLPNCCHLCNKICHDGDCTDDTFICTQLCTKPRPDCGHNCNRPCHEDDCELNIKPCYATIELHCICAVRSIDITCEKLDKVHILLKSDAICNKREVLDFCVSDNDSTISLSCDSECKKVARTKQLAEAFETESFNFDRVSFSSFLRDFSIKNPDFLVQIDSTLCSLIKKLDTGKLKKIVHRFESMNRDKRRFIHEISELFAMSSNSADPDMKCSIVVEAVKGICKIPSNRLLHFIQKNYPQLFRTDKPTSLKNVKVPPVSINDFSYAERMKSITQINKSS